MRRALAALVIVALTATSAGAATFLTRRQALSQRTVVLSGERSTALRLDAEPGTTYDMRGWTSTAYHESETAYPLDVRGLDGSYVIGPTVLGSNPLSWTWQRWEVAHHGDGLRLENAGAGGVYSYRADDVFDFVSAVSGTVLVSDSRGTHIRDDCLENDDEVDVTLRRVLCDGAHMGLSIGQDSTNAATVTRVVGSVIILSPAPNDDAADGVGHSRLFKQLGAGRVVMRDTVVCYTEDPMSSPDKLGLWMPGTYRNVRIVLGADFTLDESRFGSLPAGVTVTRDWSVCTDARDAWLAAHPRLAG